MDDIKIVFAQDRRNAEVHEAYERILVKYNEQVAQERENLK